MNSSRIGWIEQYVQAGSEIAELLTDSGVPGVGLLARFGQHFYEQHLQRRFERFVSAAEIDQDLIDKIINDESYSNCFYAVLDAVRQTHSSIGLVALALIYRDYWNDEAFAIDAIYSFSQISNKVIEAFMALYESIPDGQNYLDLVKHSGEDRCFHDLYAEATELIRRNFFLMTSGIHMYANHPIQGMKWSHSKIYYDYCQQAKARVEHRDPEDGGEGDC